MRSPRTTTKSGPCSPQLEKAVRSNEDPTQPKINKVKKKKKKEEGPTCLMMGVLFPEKQSQPRRVPLISCE